jgi:hypothetical protein
MLNNNKDSSNVIIDVYDDDYLYKDFDFDIDGKILIDKKSVDNLIMENDKLKKEIIQLRRFTNIKIEKIEKIDNKYSFKQLILKCFHCLD